MVATMKNSHRERHNHHTHEWNFTRQQHWLQVVKSLKAMKGSGEASTFDTWTEVLKWSVVKV